MHGVFFAILSSVRVKTTTFSFSFNGNPYIGIVSSLTYYFRNSGVLIVQLYDVKPVIKKTVFTYVPTSLLLNINYPDIEIRGREIIFDFNNGEQPTSFGTIFSFRT